MKDEQVSVHSKSMMSFKSKSITGVSVRKSLFGDRKQEDEARSKISDIISAAQMSHKTNNSYTRTLEAKLEEETARRKDLEEKVRLLTPSRPGTRA